jgi:NitT/TauT family transport system permease protein
MSSLTLFKRFGPVWRRDYERMEMKSPRHDLQLKLTKYLPPFGLFVVSIILWQAFVDYSVAPQLLIPSPIQVSEATLANWSAIKENVPYTIYEALAGFFLGFALGTSAAVLFLRSNTLRRALLPYALATSAVPIVVFAPIADVLFGLGMASKIILVAVLVFFPMLVETFKGLSSADPLQLEMVQTFAPTDLQMFTKLRVHNALPYVFAGMRLTFSISLGGAIVAEFFGSERGLGYLMVTRLQIFQMALAWGTIVISAVLGILAYLLVVLLEVRVLFWWPEFRRSG